MVQGPESINHVGKSRQCVIMISETVTSYDHFYFKELAPCIQRDLYYARRLDFGQQQTSSVP